LDLSGRYPGYVFPALGLHPWRLETDDLGTNFSLIRKELPGCPALGEIGLDFAIKTPKDRQAEVLRRLLEMAIREQKPVLLHARRAWAEALDLLKAYEVGRAVFHWYSGPADVLQEILARGYFISATPAAAYSEKHRRAVQMAPLNQLLLETDCPEVYRGIPSEPKDLLTVLTLVSELYGKEKEEIAGRTFLNAQNFFKLNLPGESS
jgi:TatD DNase family protein